MVSSTMCDRMAFPEIVTMVKDITSISAVVKQYKYNFPSHVPARTMENMFCLKYCKSGQKKLRNY